MSTTHSSDIGQRTNGALGPKEGFALWSLAKLHVYPQIPDPEVVAMIRIPTGCMGNMGISEVHLDDPAGSTFSVLLQVWTRVIRGFLENPTQLQQSDDHVPIIPADRRDKVQAYIEWVPYENDEEPEDEAAAAAAAAEAAAEAPVEEERVIQPIDFNAIEDDSDDDEGEVLDENEPEEVRRARMERELRAIMADDDEEHLPDNIRKSIANFSKNQSSVREFRLWFFYKSDGNIDPVNESVAGRGLTASLVNLLHTNAAAAAKAIQKGSKLVIKPNTLWRSLCSQTQWIKFASIYLGGKISPNTMTNVEKPNGTGSFLGVFSPMVILKCPTGKRASFPQNDINKYVRIDEHNVQRWDFPRRDRIVAIAVDEIKCTKLPTMIRPEIQIRAMAMGHTLVDTSGLLQVSIQDRIPLSVDLDLLANLGKAPRLIEDVVAVNSLSVNAVVDRRTINSVIGGSPYDQLSDLRMWKLGFLSIHELLDRLVKSDTPRAAVFKERRVAQMSAIQSMVSQCYQQNSLISPINKAFLKYMGTAEFQTFTAEKWPTLNDNISLGDQEFARILLRYESIQQISTAHRLCFLFVEIWSPTSTIPMQRFTGLAVGPREATKSHCLNMIIKARPPNTINKALHKSALADTQGGDFSGSCALEDEMNLDPMMGNQFDGEASNRWKNQQTDVDQEIRTLHHDSDTGKRTLVITYRTHTGGNLGTSNEADKVARIPGPQRSRITVAITVNRSRWGKEITAKALAATGNVDIETKQASNKYYRECRVRITVRNALESMIFAGIIKEVSMTVTQRLIGLLNTHINNNHGTPINTRLAKTLKKYVRALVIHRAFWYTFCIPGSAHFGETVAPPTMESNSKQYQLVKIHQRLLDMEPFLYDTIGDFTLAVGFVQELGHPLILDVAQAIRSYMMGKNRPDTTQDFLKKRNGTDYNYIKLCGDRKRSKDNFAQCIRRSITSASKPSKQQIVACIISLMRHIVKVVKRKAGMNNEQAARGTGSIEVPVIVEGDFGGLYILYDMIAKPDTNDPMDCIVEQANGIRSILQSNLSTKFSDTKTVLFGDVEMHADVDSSATPGLDPAFCNQAPYIWQTINLMNDPSKKGMQFQNQFYRSEMHRQLDDGDEMSHGKDAYGDKTVTLKMDLDKKSAQDRLKLLGYEANIKDVDKWHNLHSNIDKKGWAMFAKKRDAHKVFDYPSTLLSDIRGEMDKSYKEQECTWSRSNISGKMPPPDPARARGDYDVPVLSTGLLDVFSV